MSKWTVRVPIYADAFVIVEAESEEEAIDKATRNLHASLCHQCSKQVELGEIDVSADATAEREDDL